MSLQVNYISSTKEYVEKETEVGENDGDSEDDNLFFDDYI